MTNSNLFKSAHKLAKTFEGDYSACFALALKEIREMKNENELVINESKIQNQATPKQISYLGSLLNNSDLKNSNKLYAQYIDKKNACDMISASKSGKKVVIVNK